MFDSCESPQRSSFCVLIELLLGFSCECENMALTRKQAVSPFCVFGVLSPQDSITVQFHTNPQGIQATRDTAQIIRF